MRPSQAEQEDAGEGYFASISDLMVGILFIFLLMLAVFAINYATDDPAEKDKEIRALKEKVAALTLDVEDLRKLLRLRDREIASQRDAITILTQERDALRRVLTDLAEQLESVNIALSDDQGRLERIRGELLFAIQKGLASRNVTVDVDIAQGILRLSSEGLFELNEARFTTDGEIKARALIEEMGRLLPCYSISKNDDSSCKKQPIFETVLVEGHTDTLLSPAEGGNWRLSTDRARAFLRLIDDSALPLKDLKNDRNQLLFGLAGYGDTRNLLNIDGKDKRNRRIEVRFLLSNRREDLSENIQRLGTVLSTLRSLAGNRP